MIEFLLISTLVSLLSVLARLVIEDFLRWREQWLYILERNRLERQFQAGLKALKKANEYLSVELPKTFEDFGIAMRYAFEAMDSSKIKAPLEASKENP